MLIEIIHTRADGTLIHGTRKGDGVGDIIGPRGVGFRWSRHMGCWFLRNSRDRQANRRLIDRAADGLREAGFHVTVTVDEDTRRPFADAEQERYERAENRADRFAEYARNAGGRADAAYSAYRGIADEWPAGQPLISDQARRTHRRMFNAHEQAMREDDKAAHWSGRADTAGYYRAGREAISTTLRRIERLEAKQRIYRRALDGDTTHGWGWSHSTWPEEEAELNRRIAELDDQITYWRRHVEAAEEAGVKIWGSGDFQRGDLVQFERRHWFEVLRVNRKTLTVPPLILAPNFHGPLTREMWVAAGLSWTDKLPYTQVTGRKPAGEW